MGVFVPCFLLRSSMTPCFGLGCAKLTFSLGISLLLTRDGVTEKVCRYQGKLSSDCDRDVADEEEVLLS